MQWTIQQNMTLKRASWQKINISEQEFHGFLRKCDSVFAMKKQLEKCIYTNISKQFKMTKSTQFTVLTMQIYADLRNLHVYTLTINRTKKCCQQRMIASLFEWELQFCRLWEHRVQVTTHFSASIDEVFSFICYSGLRHVYPQLFIPNKNICR